MAGKEEGDIASFTETLGELKEAFLDITDDEGVGQNVKQVVDVVQERIDKMYNIIKAILLNNGKPPAGTTLETTTIYQLFEQRRPGVFSDLGSRLAVKEEMIRVLDVQFKEYSYTPNPKHATVLKSKQTPASKVIVPNWDSDTNNAI